MIKVKRWFQVFILVIVFWFSSMGCVTKGLWKEGTISNAYSDKIIAFYLTPQREYIAFIGEKYHYVFTQNTADFIDLLKNREFMHLQQKHLHVDASVMLDEKNSMIAHIQVKFDLSGLNTAQKKYLKSKKFIKNYAPPIISNDELLEVKEGGIFLKNYILEGRRYLVKQEVNHKAQKLTQAMPLDIKTFKKENDLTLYKIMMTPLAVTADAGLVLAGAIILPIVWLTTK